VAHAGVRHASTPISIFFVREADGGEEREGRAELAFITCAHLVV